LEKGDAHYASIKNEIKTNEDNLFDELFTIWYAWFTSSIIF
jgi:hypothetical protein